MGNSDDPHLEDVDIQFHASACIYMPLLGTSGGHVASIMNREKESKGNVFLLKTSVCLRFSLLLLFFSLNPLLAKAEIIGNMDLHLWFTIDRETKTAMVGTDRIQDDNTAPMLQGVVYGEPGYDPTWQAPWRNLVIPSTISYNGEEYTVTKIAHRAFRRTIEFKTITLPPTIREIGAEAFYW